MKEIEQGAACALASLALIYGAAIITARIIIEATKRCARFARRRKAAQKSCGRCGRKCCAADAAAELARPHP